MAWRSQGKNCPSLASEKKTKCDEYFHYCFFEGAVFALELLIIDTTYIAVKCNGSKQQQRLNSHGHFNNNCAYKCVY